MEMTIPMRIAILMHEFSHFYLNEQMDNEIEGTEWVAIVPGFGIPKN
jgi:hypothetical protein